MAIRVVRLGSQRERGEGLRIGTVRRPPRGVPKAQYASQDWYDVWLPDLAPSAALLACISHHGITTETQRHGEEGFSSEAPSRQKSRMGGGRPEAGLNWFRLALYYSVSPCLRGEKSGLGEVRSRLGDEVYWRRFEQRYRAEMKRPETARLLDLLAALSHQTNFAVGCYCEDERRCHRSILRRLLQERGAVLA